MKFQAEQVKAILNTSQQSLEKVADRINDSQRTLNGTLSDISRIQPSDGLDSKGVHLRTKNPPLTRLHLRACSCLEKIRWRVDQ